MADSKFAKFLIKLGINSAAVEIIGGRLVGSLSVLNGTNAGGYMEPNKIDGYTFNESDGKWYGYPPAPDKGVYGWFDPANAGKQLELTQQRYWRELNNHVEKVSPVNGSAGDLNSPSLWDFLRNLPEIIDRYKELSIELYRDLRDSFGYDGLGIEGIDYDINGNVNSNFTAARNWTAPRDPLILDLDNDGIEAVGINPSAPILFDMDGDGVKTATGWIKADDGIVVLDRNGNGLIDSGRELFGDSTVLTRGPRAGQTAANGYEALADLDINGDGAIDSADAAYADLRVWQDANQDGISQANELRTLSDAGIASMNVAGQVSNINLGNGNTQQLSGSFTRMNGGIGNTAASGVAEVSGSLLLASNNFYREFTDDPVVTTAAQALPQMQGSGKVRDLREAMSLGASKPVLIAIKEVAACARRMCARWQKNSRYCVVSTSHKQTASHLSTTWSAYA